MNTKAFEQKLMIDIQLHAAAGMGMSHFIVLEHVVSKLVNDRSELSELLPVMVEICQPMFANASQVFQSSIERVEVVVDCHVVFGQYDHLV